MSTLLVVQHEPRSVDWWRQQRDLERLELSPKYQRRSDLWSKYKKAHLIDSIVNGFDIPKIYIADFTIGRSALNESKRPYAVIDGKQRFESIFGFLSNQFPLNASSIYDADPSRRIKGLFYADLVESHPDIAKRIREFSPVVMSVSTDDDKKIYEMFVRLNSGEAATSAERRNAKPGPIPHLVRELVDHPFFSSRIGFSVKRMADLNLAAKLLLIEHREGFVETKASNLDRFVQEAADRTVPSAFKEPTKEQMEAIGEYTFTRDRVIGVLERLAEIFHDRDPLLRAAGRIPVYYWVVRNHPVVVPNFRDFVGDFEDNVIAAMRQARDGDASGSIYATYYTLSRTTNDQKSLRARYEIMREVLSSRNLI